MSIALCMVVRNEWGRLERCVTSARDLVDEVIVVDTGSVDDTPHLARELGAVVYRRDWVDFGHNRTELLDLARGLADWLLLLDADMTVEAHSDLVEWLAGDPDPDVAAWMVEVREHWGWYRLPLLIRGNVEWRYEGRTHEALDLVGRKSRPLLGLTVQHTPEHGPEKHERDLELLSEADDPRSVFYAAQALRNLGRTEEAIEQYQRRAAMGGWEEEAWYAAYQAALLGEDVEALFAAHARRPWRHEPLTAAARIVVERGSGDDMLFIEG